MTERELPPVKVAFILDNEIVDILHTDERLAAILLSNPIIYDVTGKLIEDGGTVNLGATYNASDDTFSPFEPPINVDEQTKDPNA